MKINSGFISILSFLGLISLTYQQQEPLQVKIVSQDDFCLIVPKDFQTPVGNSEYPGGMTAWCQGSKTSPSNGQFNGQFWNNVEISTPKDGVIQMTGCFNPDTCDRIDPNDSGGQYDSNGGDGGQGNPMGSSCAQYPVYVQLLEPSARRACIRCCQNAADCDVSQDTAGCPAVIPGNYFNCG